MEDELTFGSRLCQLRKKNGITQRDLAQKLGVHITTIKNWEGGNCYPDAKNICALADLLHVSADSLLGREEGDTVSLAEALLLCAKSYGKLYKYSLIAIMRLNRKQMISVVC